MYFFLCLEYCEYWHKKVILFSHKFENEYDLSKYNPEITFKVQNNKSIIGERAKLEKSEEETKNEFNERWKTKRIICRRL